MISKLFEKIELSKLRCQTIVILFLSRFPPPLFLLYVINFTRRGPFFVCWQHSHTQRIYIWRIILLTKICRSTLQWNRYLYIMQWVLKLWLESLYLYHRASITSNITYHRLYFYKKVTKGPSKIVFWDVHVLLDITKISFIFMLIAVGIADATCLAWANLLTLPNLLLRIFFDINNILPWKCCMPTCSTSWDVLNASWCVCLLLWSRCRDDPPRFWQYYRAYVIIAEY